MKNLFNKIFNYIIIGFFIIMLFVVGYKLYKSITNKKPIEKTIKFYVVNESLTLDNVYKELIKQEVKYPDIVIRQCILETGHLTSYNCKVRNNLFGFYNGKEYLCFNSWQECIKYKKRWQNRKYKKGNYYTFLEKLPYATDSLYIVKLKRINYDKDS